jgi:ribose 5-phosphate isomerase B
MKEKKIIIGCDHAAYDLKLKVIDHLVELGYEVADVGTDSEASCDYPVFAHRLCKRIQSGEFELGILICGTGIGMSLVANKHKGIRAACCSDTFSARLTRNHNDANVLCFGARVVGMGLAFDLVDNFINAEYEGGKHAKRVAMIDAIENGTFEE